MRKYNEMSEEEQIELVKRNGYNIQWIINPSEKVQLEAVREDQDSIRYINNPSEKVQLEVVKYDGPNIRYINNPSEKVQLEAVKIIITSIQDINNLEYNTDNKDYPYYHIKNHKEYRMYLCDHRILYIDMSGECVKYTIGCQLNITKNKFIDRIYNDCCDGEGKGLELCPYRQEYLDIIDIVENEFEKGEM